MTQQEAIRLLNTPCHEVKTAVTDCFGGFSGGSVMGLGHIFEEGAAFDPFFLVKYAAPSPPANLDFNFYSRPQIFLAKHDDDFGYCAYNVMAPINENVIRFSTVLQGLYSRPVLQKKNDLDCELIWLKHGVCERTPQTCVKSYLPPSSSSSSSPIATWSCTPLGAPPSSSADTDLFKSPCVCSLPSPSSPAKAKIRSALASPSIRPYPAFLYYSECVALGYDVLTASVVSLVTFVLMFLITSSNCRAALTALHVFPRPGEGPPRQFLDKGHFQIKTVGRAYPSYATFMSAEASAATCNNTEKDESEEEEERGFYRRPVCHDRETTITVTMGSSLGDPGYKETGKMLVETGLALALQLKDCVLYCGVCTPASGVGIVLIDRLRKAGMKFEVKSKHFQ